MPPTSTSDLQTGSFGSVYDMSIAVLPSAPPAYGQARMFTPNTVPAKRPKLSLNTTSTTSAPYRSKQSTSLRLDTLSATSPTTRNTFGNAYTQQKNNRRPQTPLRHDSAQQDTPIDKAILLAPASPVSALAAIETQAEFAPYTLNHDVNPILRNGPIEQRHHSQRATSQTKPIFALTKRVIFRAPLTEEVKNKEYTLRHSDITTVATPLTTSGSAAPDALTPASIESSASTHNTSCPATPIAGRNKKDRHWYWTLGPQQQQHELDEGNEISASPGEVDSTI